MVESAIVISDDEDDVLVSASTWLSPSRRKAAANLRNAPVLPPYVFETSARLPSLAFVRPNDTVEVKALTQDGTCHEFEFLRIKHIIKDITTDAVTLRGLRLRRNTYAKGILPLEPPNEVYLVLDVEDDDKRPLLEQGMVDVPLEDVIRKRDVKLTNRGYLRRDCVGDHLQLTCRWMHIVCYKDSIARQKGDRRRRYCESWVRLAKADCDYGTGLPEGELKRQFRTEGDLSHLERKKLPRKDNVRSPASNHLTPQTRTNVIVIRSPSVEAPPQQLVDFTVNNHAPSSPVAPCESGYKQGYSPPCQKRSREESHTTSATRSPHKLSFLDTFAGGGGVSRGAFEAGYDVVEAFDRDYDAYFVDVVHFSPPCPAYSRMNRTRYTETDRNNENKDAATCIESILYLRRPRIATVEQTDHMLDFPEHFNSLLRQFIDCGYSVRWKVMQLEEYGLPQKRKRLIIIASCPGEVLPDFPKPTHSADQSLRLLPLVTIHDAISSIPTGWSNHNLHNVKRHDPTDPRFRPFRADEQCRTVCTGGVGHHPSGTRDYTIRELACLQGFPLKHKFVGNKVTVLKKQIGNAFPPIVVKALLQEIAKALNGADTVE